MNFKGTFAPKRDVQCQHCGRIVGPKRPVKMMYIQYGAGAGNFCSNSCAQSAYQAVTNAFPELKTKVETVFKGING